MQERGATGATRKAEPEGSTTPTPARPTTRGARRRYLEVATEVAARVRPGARSYLAAVVELADLADRMGRPRTSLYRLWGSQTDFWNDLTLHLTFQHDYLKPDEWLPWDASKLPIDLPSTRDPAADTEVVRVTLGLIQEWALADPWIQVRAALLGYADVPEVAAARRRIEARRIRHLAARTAGVLALSGAGVTPPLRPIDLAAGLWCLGDGLAVLNRTRPTVGSRRIDVDRGLGPRPWGLFAYAAEATLAAVAAPGAASLDGPVPAGPSPAALYDQVSARWTPAQREALQEATDLFLERIVSPEAGAGSSASSTGPSSDEPDVRSLGHVTVAAVAREAGVSRRSIYNHWSSSEDLRLDLLRWLLVAERNRYLVGLDRAIAARPRTDADRIDAVVSALLVHPTPERIPIPHLPLAFLAEVDHATVRTTLERGHEETLGAVATRLDRLWPADRRASGAALDAEGLAALVLGLVTGAGRLLRIVPEALPRTDTALRTPPALLAALTPLVAPPA